ncbi:MAG: cob(I)yrinic acid a,c-diamide adenosyltransferase [Verrucomicrobiia bacterium]
MSIVSRTGDDGTTAIMYARRVPKNHTRIEAVGTIDELNAAIGLARALDPNSPANGHLIRIQKDLVALMGELATDIADLDRYRADGYSRITTDNVARLDSLAGEIESKLGKLSGWAIPGPPPSAAALDLARAVCRRCERVACSLIERGMLENRQIMVYLNRLSDVLWLMARTAGRQTL